MAGGSIAIVTPAPSTSTVRCGERSRRRGRRRPRCCSSTAPIRSSRRRRRGRCARRSLKVPYHRQLRQLPRRDERAGRSDPAGPLVPRIVGRRGARVGRAGRAWPASRRRHGAAAPDARDRRRAARRRPRGCRSRSTLPWQTFEEMLKAHVRAAAARPRPTATPGAKRRSRAAGGARCPPRSSRCRCRQPASSSGAAVGVRRSRSSTATRSSSRFTSCRTHRARSSTDRSAHLPWLQEMPDPLTSAMWSSWVEINPATAAALGIGEGDVVEITSAHGTLAAAGRAVTPGIAPDIDRDAGWPGAHDVHALRERARREPD